MKIDFKKEKDSILNKLFLKIEYMSGDADAYEYEEVEIEGIDFTNYQENLDKIKEIVDRYKLVGNLTDCNHELDITSRPNRNPKLEKYKEGTYGYVNLTKYVEDIYGEEVADIFDNVPQDVTGTDTKAHLSNIKLHAYNDKGELFISYI